ncbi:PaaI family thioesterase [Comamonadaceae bacterium PP-2]
MTHSRENAEPGAVRELEAKLYADGWRRHDSSGFLNACGPLWTRREDGEWGYGMLVTSRHLNPAGVLHGGALLTLVDHAVSTVAWQACGRIPCLTLQLDGHFVAAVEPLSFVEVRAAVRQRTRGMVFLHACAAVGEVPVFQAQAIMKIVQPKRPAAIESGPST